MGAFLNHSLDRLDQQEKRIAELERALARWIEYAENNGYSTDMASGNYCSFLGWTRMTLKGSK